LDEDYQAAIALLKQVADLLRTVNRETSPVQSNPLQSSEDVARALNALASVEQLSGDLDAAKQHYEEALHIGKAVDYQEGVATCTGNLAEVAVDREDWSGAETLAREALSLSEGIGRLELIGSNHLRLAQALVRQGKKAEALPHARRAVDIYGRLGMRNRLADARATLVECER
jgi:tetratricopeptide (TPR) repeat protein